MAAFARERGRPVSGPVHFRYSGFDVTATVEPTNLQSRGEGPRTLNALVEARGQLVYITSDNLTLGVPDDAGPRAMATAAIDMLRLAVD